MGKYSKLYVALAGAIVTWLGTYYSNDHWLQLVTALLTAGAVWAVKNDPPEPVPIVPSRNEVPPPPTAG